MNTNIKHSNALLIIKYECKKQTSSYEPRHDKTNKVTMHPAKSQISLGVHSVLSVFTWHNHFVGFVMLQLISTGT